MAEVKGTAEAEHWLQKVHDNIAEDNPRAAWRTIKGICRKAMLLERFPELGQRYEPRPDRHIRVLVYGHYRIT